METKNLLILTGWSLITLPQYKDLPDEEKPAHLQGYLVDRNKIQDNDYHVTEKIEIVQGRLVMTSDGNVYYLDDPNPNYQAWLVRKNGVFDPDNPIIVFGKDEDYDSLMRSLDDLQRRAGLVAASCQLH